MSSEARQTCARTDAVLAVHLDGDLWPTARDRETFGYAFVSDDSLHAHLRDCATCQQALQRSRRLDAALASTAGRELSQHDDLEALGDRLLQRAFAAARAPTGTDGSAGDAVRGPADGPATAASGASEALLVGDRSGDSWPATWLAAGMLAAAAAATWLCLGTPRASEDRDAAPTRRAPTEHTAHAPQVDSPPPVSPMPVSPRPATATADPDAPPLSLARRMHAAEREAAANAADDAAPGQQSLSLHELAQRIARRELGVPERLAAAERLIRRTRPGSSEVREATGRLLAALASCGDDDDHELLLHEQLLDVVRDDGPLLVRLEHRLASIRGELDRDEQSAMLVAARVGTPRLDLALRRVVRRNPEAAELVAAALRCGVRVDGAPELLLDCWHDLAALGKQAHSQREASFWFQGQAATTFAALADTLRAAHSSKARERILLAMGCAADDSTVRPLLARLSSPRKAEAFTAACALAMLPHRVLQPLLPKARTADQGLLRAALARAGLPASQSWVRSLGLSAHQRVLLREGPVARFSEVAAWFRNGASFSD